MYRPDKQLKKIKFGIDICHDSVSINEQGITALVGFFTTECDADGRIIDTFDEPCGHKCLEVKFSNQRFLGSNNTLWKLERTNPKEYEQHISLLIKLVILFALESYLMQAYPNRYQRYGDPDDTTLDEYRVGYLYEESAITDASDFLKKAVAGNEFIFQFNSIDLPWFEAASKQAVTELLGDTSDVYCPSVKTDHVLTLGEGPFA